MLKLRRATVAGADPAPGAEQRLLVELADAPRRAGDAAIADVGLVGRAQIGDELIVNVQALDLGLGSGGFDVVHVNLTRGLSRRAGTQDAHVMKLNYTSLQHAVAPVEDERAGAAAAAAGRGARAARPAARRSRGPSPRLRPARGSATCRPRAARCPAGTRARSPSCASAACWPGT